MNSEYLEKVYDDLIEENSIIGAEGTDTDYKISDGSSSTEQKSIRRALLESRKRLR